MTAVPSSYSLHFQTTVVDQGHARLRARYSGPNSLEPDPESAASITSTLFLGWRPRPGTELYLNPELSGGRGMSGTRGIAGFPNGEAFRVGDAQPTLLTARLFVRQVFGFEGGTENIRDGANQVAGALPQNRLIVVAGKFSLADYFDDNAYAHDPRSQFMNWALMDSIAWDYPADTRGYTWGAMSEYHRSSWAVRAAAVAEPKAANLMDMDRRIGRAHGFVLEGQRALSCGAFSGTARLLGFLNEARMGDYDQALEQSRRTGATPDVAATRGYGRTKFGLATSDDLALSDDLGAFMRLSWSDGRSEAWTFAEVDHAAALGVDWRLARYGRPKDHWGFAETADGLSGPHRRYLAGGGAGFMLGDAALHYGPELITETYYSLQANEFLSVSPDAQLVINPGYNRARGPVLVWGLRVHAEF